MRNDYCPIFDGRSYESLQQCMLNSGTDWARRTDRAPMAHIVSGDRCTSPDSAMSANTCI